MRLHPSHPTLLALATCALLGACTPEEGAGPVGAGSWVLEAPDVRIGTLDDGPAALTRVGQVAVGPDGRVYVLQPEDGQIRVFTADGAFEAVIGRRGEGPGELTTPSAMGFLGDTLWVRDARLRRVTRFATDGTHLADAPYPEEPPVGAGERAAFMGLTGGGVALYITAPAFQSPLEGTAHPFPLLALHTEDGRVDTLGTRNVAHHQALFVQSSGDRIMSMEILTQPFSDQGLWALEGGGNAVILVDRTVPDVASGATYGITRVSLAGDTLAHVRVPYDPVAVAPLQVDSLLARYTRGGRSESELRDALFLPRTHPPASDVVAGSDGTVWVGREAIPDAPRRWDVFDGNGTLIAHTETPPGMRIHRAERTAVWGVVTDELDVPYVVRMAVRPWASGDDPG